MSLNNEACMIRATLIGLSRTELNYYPLMISLDKRNGICDIVDDLPTKICVLSKTKDLHVKVSNMITIINEFKTYFMRL